MGGDEKHGALGIFLIFFDTRPATCYAHGCYPSPFCSQDGPRFILRIPPSEGLSC